MERQAFARAWKFLDYKPVAKWTALIAAVLSGVLFVALLMILGLYCDLMISRGRVPAFRDLSPYNREHFQQRWHDLGVEDRKRLLQVVGVDADSAAGLAEKPTDDLNARDWSLLWRSHLHPLLESRVGSTAASYMLPEYRDLPPKVQAGFQKWWSGLNENERAEWLTMYGEQAATVAASKDYALLWRARLYQRIKEQTQREDVADAYWSDRGDLPVGADSLGESVDRELQDRGILSLVVRAQHQLFGPAVGLTARLLPWTWKGSATRPNFTVYLLGLLGIGVVLALLRALALYTLKLASAIASIEASNRLRRAVYHHTHRLGRLAFRALGPSEAVGVFTRQIETVHNGLYVWLTVIFREPVKFALVLAFALAVNFWLSLAFLLFAVLVWVVGGQVAVFFRRQEREATHQAADQLALLQESLMMMRLVKVYLMEAFNQSRVERQLARYTVAQMRRYRGEALYVPLFILLGSVAVLILLYVAGMVVMSGRIEVASVIVLVTALVSLYLPVVNWMEERRLLRKARESALVLFKFLDRPGEVGQVVGAEFLAPLSKSLEFDNVSLQEPGTGRKLLQNVSFKIQAGQKVALIGPDDMEKHALVYLVPRFLDPNAGEVRIDSHNVRWVTFESLRAQTAMVLQHNLVFNDKVATNISCGDPGYDLPKIIEAAKIAHAHHFIQKLPRGYETAIGEMGHYLNPSEKFRIALARAILRDPALVVIEEPLTPLDDEAKDLIDDTFMRFLPGRTVLFIPHRISTIRSCDRVFLLHKGRIEAAGEHRELLAQHTLYKHLHYLEFNEFAEQL